MMLEGEGWKNGDQAIRLDGIMKNASVTRVGLSRDLNGGRELALQTV